MKLAFEIKRIKAGQKGTLYTVTFEDSPCSEFEAFQRDEVCSQSPDFTRVLAKLGKMMERYGFQERLFRYESRARNSVVALSADQKPNPLRLYCCRWSEDILIAGCGGYKSPHTRTYQEDPLLNRLVARMEYVDRRLYQRITEGDITVGFDGFKGQLHFENEEEE